MRSMCHFIRTNYSASTVVSCAQSRKLAPDFDLELELQTMANWEHTCSRGVGRKLTACEFKKHVHCAPSMKKSPHNDLFSV